MSRKQPLKTWSTPVRAENSLMIPCNFCGGGSFNPSLKCEGFGYVRCTRCGLVQMNPQPDKAEVHQRYRKAFGKDYLFYELENEAAFLALQRLALSDSGFEKLEKALMLPPDNRPGVLDIGCATGALLAHLRDRGWRVTGVEISPCAEYARNERNLDVRSLPLEENHFPPESFNVVLASHLIEHLNNPRSFLDETRRILKPGGCVFITTPNIRGFQARLMGSRWRSAIFDHLYLFSTRTLKAMLKETGFAVEGVHTWGGLAAGLAPPWLKKTADRAVKLLGNGDVMIVRARSH
jgi:2-polyprenyl-3-methyl-5-hydroxy-6-metoxy-1,4-benzoquinol methylase